MLVCTSRVETPLGDARDRRDRVQGTSLAEFGLNGLLTTNSAFGADMHWP
jgi:hypothetical protein